VANLPAAVESVQYHIISERADEAQPDGTVLAGARLKQGPAGGGGIYIPPPLQLPMSLEPAPIIPEEFGDSGKAKIRVVIKYWGRVDGNSQVMVRLERIVDVTLTKVE
jgi:hypothetical protein